MHVPRYTLRAVSWAVIALSVCLAYTRFRCERFRRAVRNLEMSGAELLPCYTSWKPPLPQAIAPVVADSYMIWCNNGTCEASVEAVSCLGNISALTVRGGNGRDIEAMLRALSGRGTLVMLELDETEVSADQLRPIMTETRLERLSLTNARITTEHLKCLTRLRNLVSLDLQGTEVDDSVFAILAQLPALRSVNLDRTFVSRNAAEAFADAHSHIRL